MGRVKLMRRKFDRRVKKKCPGCEKEIPVACKTCPLCRHQFSNSKVKSPKSGDEEVLPVKRRRTKRTQRERPDFFNSLELDRRFKKKRKRRESTASTVSIASPTTPTPKPTTSAAIDGETPKKRRGRPKSVNLPEAEKDSPVPPDEDMFASLPAEKYLQYTVILAEINRKFSVQNFRPT